MSATQGRLGRKDEIAAEDGGADVAAHATTLGTAGEDRVAAGRLSAAQFDELEGGALLLSAPVEDDTGTGLFDDVASVAPNNGAQQKALFRANLTDLIGLAYYDDPRYAKLAREIASELKGGGEPAPEELWAFHEKFVKNMTWLVNHNLFGPALRKLQAEEKERVAALKKEHADVTRIRAAVYMLRGAHRDAFAAHVKSLIHDGYATYERTMWAEVTFKERGPGKYSAAPAKDDERMTVIPEDLRVGRHGTAKAKGWSFWDVDEHVALFLNSLAAKGWKFGAGTYKAHGPYAVDLFPEIRKVDGFYERGEAAALFKAIDKSAHDSGCEWYAAYNDALLLDEVGSLGSRIRFGFGHGPDPYVLHIHVDIRPTKPLPWETP